MKPMHGVNNGPKSHFNMNYDTSAYFVEAGIPTVRLHDTEYPYGAGVYVDIHCVFPDFDADPDDPASYQFHHTDLYIKAIIDTGAQIVYRLGESIDWMPKKTYVFPPKDNLKWAQICAGIIRHYNEGWADGFHHDIRYWEIWNEPENSPNLTENPMWQGPIEEFFALYEVAANYLKQRFPDIKIGGYGCSGFYDDHFISVMHAFLKHIASPQHKAPLDFFSWHSYAETVEINVAYAQAIRQVLNQYGFTNTECSLNEWNPRPCKKGNWEDAAIICANMCALQKSSLDSCQYYDAQAYADYCGLFNTATRGVYKAFHAFKAFNALYALKTEVQSSSDDSNLYVCAASDGDRNAALLVNTGGESMRCALELVGAVAALRCAAIDQAHDLTPVHDVLHAIGGGREVRLGAYGIVLIEC